jgi:hypothetical protein
MVTYASILEMSDDFMLSADLPYDCGARGPDDTCRKRLKEVGYADGQ